LKSNAGTRVRDALLPILREARETGVRGENMRAAALRLPRLIEEGREKKAHIPAGFVSMYRQCLNRCYGPRYLRGAQLWKPVLSARCRQRVNRPMYLELQARLGDTAFDITHVVARPNGRDQVHQNFIDGTQCITCPDNAYEYRSMPCNAQAW
jgi:hypothetical protein